LKNVACLFWQRVQVEIALAAQVQAELKNKNLTALEEVKLLKALEETGQSGSLALQLRT
jgi:hypothetical protein